MYGYWSRVGNGLVNVIRSLDMASDKPKLLAEYFWEMAGYFWLRVENGLFYIVKSSYMAGDEPKWLAGHCKKLIYV